MADEVRLKRGLHLRGPLTEGGIEHLFTVMRCSHGKKGANVTLKSISRTGVGGSELDIEARVFFPGGVVRPPFRVEE